MYELTTSDGSSLINKPWRVDSDVSTFAKHLNRKCDGSHQHAVIDGNQKDLRATQSYTKELVGCIHKAWYQFIRIRYGSKGALNHAMMAVSAQAQRQKRPQRLRHPIPVCKQSTMSGSSEAPYAADQPEESPYAPSGARSDTLGEVGPNVPATGDTSPERAPEQPPAAFQRTAEAKPK